MTKYKPVYPRHTWQIVKEDMASFEKDMKEICDMAIKKGANLAKLIEASKIAVDERVTLKCTIPPCEMYGQSLCAHRSLPQRKRLEKSSQNMNVRFF